jgi:hypothetical protein
MLGKGCIFSRLIFNRKCCIAKNAGIYRPLFGSIRPWEPNQQAGKRMKVAGIRREMRLAAGPNTE